MTEPTAIVPDKGIRPGLNETAATIPARRLVVKVAGTLGPDGIALPAADTDPTMGVTMAAILDDERGDVQTEGMAIVEASVAIAEGEEVAPDAATGKAKVAAAADYVSGVARSASAADTDLIEVELNGPHAGRIKA